MDFRAKSCWSLELGAWSLLELGAWSLEPSSKTIRNCLTMYVYFLKYYTGARSLEPGAYWSLEPGSWSQAPIGSGKIYIPEIMLEPKRAYFLEPGAWLQAPGSAPVTNSSDRQNGFSGKITLEPGARSLEPIGAWSLEPGARLQLY